MLCIWKYTQSKYKAPFSIWQWKKTAKHLISFLNVFILTLFFFVIHVLHMKFFFFFFFLSSWCWNVVRWEGWERQKHTTETGRRQLALLHTRMAAGGEGGPNQKTKEDMYNHLCGQETERRPSDGLWRLPMPHTLAAFLWGFSFYFFKHTNNSHYIILPN